MDFVEVGGSHVGMGVVRSGFDEQSLLGLQVIT